MRPEAHQPIDICCWQSAALDERTTPRICSARSLARTRRHEESIYVLARLHACRLIHFAII